MTSVKKREAIILFIGDIFFFIFSLWISLYVRTFKIPTTDFFTLHLVPFSILFCFWVIVFFIAGLYEKHTLILKGKLPSLIFNAQVVNSIGAIVFFYTIPIFGITPKTTLFIYLFVSFVLILFWRLYGHRVFSGTQREQAILIGSGVEMKELLEEVNTHGHYGLHFSSSLDLQDINSIDIQEEIVKPIYTNGTRIVAVDFSSERVGPLLPHLYNLIFSHVRFIDSHRIYEDIFNRIPLSLVTYSWFLENISVSPKFTYDFLKRVMDIVVASLLGMISLFFYPIIALLIKLDDGGKIFILQERVGQSNRPIRIIKFRTMSIDDGGEGDGQRHTKITRLGKVLRATRIDELPQLWNVLKGDLSLIGPRPELPNLVKLYEKEISFYNVRHLIKPGLSGWAQLYQVNPPKFSTDYVETKVKLSYDLFYIKNRSFWLDIKIALKTIKKLLSKSGV